VKCAVECGTKSVDGLDISIDMVRKAKQTTADLDNVIVSMGDATNMPYGDNTFDLAVSFFVICTLWVDAFIKQFKELHQVLTPGGKAVVITHARPAFDSMFVHASVNRVLLEKMFQSILAKLPREPTNELINEEFAVLDDVVLATFALDESGCLYRVTDTSQLRNGHPIWIKPQTLTFPDHYYSDEFVPNQIKAAGLSVDQIECYCTEERRIAYNKRSQRIQLEKAITDNPPYFLYHLSKPTGKL